MNKELASLIGDELIKIGNKFKAGTSQISEEQAIDIFRIVTHEPISREDVCKQMNINNSKFYDLLNLKKIPPGRKRRGFKELYWYKDEIIEVIERLHIKN